jgi:hypothetical protein
LANDVVRRIAKQTCGGRHGSKPGKRGYADREFYTVHDRVTSAVEQTRAISRRCRLASTGIGRRDETFPTDRFVPVDVGSRRRVDLSPRLKLRNLKNLWKVFT